MMIYAVQLPIGSLILVNSEEIGSNRSEDHENPSNRNQGPNDGRKPNLPLHAGFGY
jgi:hypothetical protein